MTTDLDGHGKKPAPKKPKGGVTDIGLSTGDDDALATPKIGTKKTATKETDTEEQTTQEKIDRAN